MERVLKTFPMVLEGFDCHGGSEFKLTLSILVQDIKSVNRDGKEKITMKLQSTKNSRNRIFL